MIKTKQLSCKYSSQLVLLSLDLEIMPGEITAVVGRNGSGKSTLAHILAGLNLAFQGQVWLDDLKLNRRTPNRALRQKVGLVLQNPEHQILFSCVYDEIDFILQNLNLPASNRPPQNRTVQRETIRAQRKAIITNVLKLVGLSEQTQNDPRQLSGGQKQRLALAGALVVRPQYLILDEATSMLDLAGRREIYRTLAQLKKQGIGIIMMTNSLEEILLADVVFVLDEGKIHQFSPQTLIEKPQILAQYGLEVPLLLEFARKFQTFSLESLRSKL